MDKKLEHEMETGYLRDSGIFEVSFPVVSSELW